MVMSSVVPMKGASDEWTVKRILAFIKELRLEPIPLVLKCDQEPAALSVANEVIRRRGIKTFLENPPV